MGPLQVWPMVKSTRRYIGTALRGALYTLSYLLFVVCMLHFYYPWSGPLKSWHPACMNSFQTQGTLWKSINYSVNQNYPLNH